MANRRARRGWAGALAAGAWVLAAYGCASGDPEQAGREAAARAKAAIRAIDADAYDQKIAPEVVKTVQQQLTAIKEYQGPIDGKLDPVTLNAFEAFQRSQGVFCMVEHGSGHARQASHLNAITFAGGARLNFMQKHHVVAAFGGAYMHVHGGALSFPELPRF